LPDKSIFKTLTVAAGADDKVPIYKVPTNCKLTTTRVEIIFMADAALNLSLSLKEGELQKLPEHESFQGNSMRLVSTARVTWGPGSSVDVKYENTHATEARTAFINISAEET